MTKQEVRLARQPKPMAVRALVPPGTPSRERWHVRRDRVMTTVLRNFARDRGLRMIGLVGASGAGKTTAAAEIIRSAEVLEFFSDGVVWLSVGEGASDRLPYLMLQLARMVREGIGSKLDGGCSRVEPEDGTAFVKDVMDRGSIGGRLGLRCLLVADNVCESNVLAKLQETGMWVLATCCEPQLVRGLGGRTARIGRLFEADAELVLRRASELPSGEGSPAASKDLVKLCDRVAIDLAFVGRWSAIRGSDDPLAWASAAEKIRSELRNLELTQEDAARDSGGGGRATRRKDILSANFHGRSRGASEASGGAGGGGSSRMDRRSTASSETNTNTNTTTTNTPRVDVRMNRRKALYRAGFRDLVVEADDDRVQWLYLALAVMPDGHEFSTKDAMVLLYGNYRKCGDEEERAVRNVLNILERWTFLKSTGDNYRMHDVHARFARETLMGCPEVRRSALKRWAGFISSLDAVLYFDPFMLARLWSTVELVGGKGWREIWRATRPYEKALAELDNADPLCRLCLEAVAKFRSAEGDWEGASALWRRLLAVEQRALEPDVMYPLWELVGAAERMGKPDEAAMWRRHGYEKLNLAMARTLSPRDIGGGRAGDSAGIIRSLTLNMIRFGPSHGVEAEMMLRRALEIEMARRGPDDTRVAAILQRLGVCVRQAGRLEEAERLLTRAIAIEKARTGTDDVLVARAMFHLGVCVRLAGRIEDAEKLLRQSLDIETVRRGPDDVHVGRTLYELGLCARFSGRLTEARELLGRALEIRETRLGPDDVSVGQTLYELGVCVRQDGRQEESEVFLRRALVIKKAAAVGSEDDVSMAPTLFQLGICVLQAGRRLEEAETLLRNVLEIEETRLGRDDVSVARIVFHLGVCLQRAGRREEAESVLRRAVETLRARLGPLNDEVATANKMLGQCAATE